MRFYFILPFLAGALAVLGFSPFSYYFVPFVSIGLLFYLSFFHAQRLFFSGLAFGLGLFSFGVSWIFNSLKEFGNLHFWEAILITFLFCFCLSLFYAFALFIFQKIKTKNIFFSAFLFSSLCTIFEYLRGNFIFGFPWLILGYSQTQNPLLNAYFPLFGAYFLSFLCFFIPALIVIALYKKHFLTFFCACSFFIFNFIISSIEWTKPEKNPLSVLLVQNYISLADKFNSDFFEKHSLNNFQTIENYSADLFVFSETEIPYFWNHLPPAFKKHLQSLSFKKNAHFIFGVLTSSDDLKNYFNSAVHIHLNKNEFYHKKHLVPFGEFTPPYFEWLMKKINVPLSNFKKPEQPNQNFHIQNYQAALNICYEDIFGRELKENAQNAHFLINISNTIWFGKSLAQAQHLEMAQARALEYQKPILKSTNSGITAVIDFNGKILKQLPEFEKGVLKEKIFPRSGKTGYCVWTDFPILGLCFFILILRFLKKIKLDRGK